MSDVSEMDIPLRKGTYSAKRKRKSRSLQKRLSTTFRKKGDSFTTASRLNIHPFIKQGDREALHRLVISHGKKVIHERSITQQTPLHVAAEEGHLHIVEFLLANGAKLDVLDMNGWTPLHCACYRGHIDIVMYFLAAGADCLTVTDDGNTPLHYFILKISPDHRLFNQIFQEMLKRTTELLNLPNGQGETCLYHAVLCNQETIVSEIIKNKGNVNFSNNNGETLVHLASRNGNLSMIKLLLDSNALPDLGESELIGKASNLEELGEFPEIRKYLLSAERKTNPRRKNDGNSLDHAGSLPEVTMRNLASGSYVMENIAEIKKAEKKRPVSGSWVGFDACVRSDSNGKKKPRPRSARGLRRDVLLKDVTTKSGNDLPERPRNFIKDNKMMSSLPTSQISLHLENMSLPEKETISEETFLFEEEPTPRTKMRRERSCTHDVSPNNGVKIPQRSVSGSRLGKSISYKQFSTPSEEVKKESKIKSRKKSKESTEVNAEEISPTKEVIKESIGGDGNFPLQKQVTIPLLRETETEEDRDESEDQVLQLEKQLMQSQAVAQQLRIELEMTKQLLAKARRKIKERDKKIYALENGLDLED